MKIRQPNSSDIEVQFPSNRKKFNYMKQPVSDKNQAAQNIPQKKPIQINTNLEPSQSKK